jgi:hypothetical protein
MRDNLIFKGIPDDYNLVKDTEGKIKDFIKSELGIEDEINFHVVHRLKPKQDKSPRGIVAKFERRKDRNKVLSKNRWLYIHRNGGWWRRRRRWWMIER